ncbi:MAG: hypothetical protein ABJQ29_15615 [Luteolibacter sp.]
MSEPEEDADDRLAPLMEYFGEQMNRTLAYFLCVLEFEGDEDLNADPASNFRAWRLQTIKNACLDGTLMALRDLDDFFTERDLTKLRPHERDGIRSQTFGYTGSHTFLTGEERTKINKLIAHTTTLGAASKGFQWDILELVTKGASQCLAFLKWIEEEYGLAHFNLFTAAFVIRQRSEKHLEFIRSEAEKRRDSKA